MSIQNGVCTYMCVKYCTHTQNKHIDAIYYHFECRSLCKTFDQLSLYNLWSAYGTFFSLPICHVTATADHVVFCYLYLFDHSFLPNLSHPSCLYSYLLPPTLPTCSYLHSLTSPLLFSCLPTCPQTVHMPTWHQVYLTALYPQQSSS